MDNPGLSAPAARKWTNADDYSRGLGRLRASRRHARKPRQRTEPEAPRALMSTVPFMVLLAALGGLTLAIMIAAWPIHDAPVAKRLLAQPERGVAAKGWFQEAQKDMHR